MDETPNFPFRILRWFCHPDMIEDIEGDLLELYDARLQKYGDRKARFLLYLDVIKLIRPDIIKTISGLSIDRTLSILSHYNRILYRSLLKNKTYSFINISGLVIGMVASLMLAKYVGFNLMYDQFHVNKDRIMLVQQSQKEESGKVNTSKLTYWKLGRILLERFPEVLRMTHVNQSVETQVTSSGVNTQRIHHNERGILTVDSSFTQIFSFPFLHGSAHSALTEPNSIVLTESTAIKYFGKVNVVGNTLVTRLPWGKKETLKITGVVEDVPAWSSIQFDFLKSSTGTTPDDEWDLASYSTYLLLDGNLQSKSLETKFTQEIKNLEEVSGRDLNFSVVLSSIAGRKLSSSEIIMGITSLCILLITWINYINLTSARVLSRADEIGVRQIIGAGKKRIFSQLIYEGMALNVFSLIVSILLLWTTYHYLEEFTAGRILPFWETTTSLNKIFITIFLVGSFLSALYPAFVLSALQPTAALKNTIANGFSGERMRSLLLVLQFCISMILIISVFVISAQLRHMRSQNLGIDLDQTMVIRSAKDGWDGKLDRFRAIKNQIGSLSVVKELCSSTVTPGGGNGQDINFQVGEMQDHIAAHLIGIDAAYMQTYKIEFLSGQNFEEGRYNWNREGIIINWTTMNDLGYTSPDQIIQEECRIQHDESQYRIIGVVNDYHQNSLKEKIEPLVFHFNPFRGHISVKIDSNAYHNYSDINNAISLIENCWYDVYSDQTFDFHFLDDSFNQAYQSDARFKTLYGIFTGISLFISCLGLFGVTLFAIQKRHKEISIRKVLGASSSQIMALFLRRHSIILIISLIIALPIGWTVMDHWLQNYHYRIAISGWMLLIPIILVAVLTTATILINTLRVSLAKPVDALRND